MLKLFKPVQAICTILFILQSCSVHGLTVDTLWENYKEEGAVNDNLPDFSYAGFFSKGMDTSRDDSDIFNVLAFGAIPDDGVDDSLAIQKAIDNASDNGGGIVFIPKGKYNIKGGTKEHTITISSSNIILMGEEAQGDNATVIYLENPSEGTQLGLIGQNKSDLRSIAALAIEGESDGSVLASFDNQDLPRGTRIIPVDDASNLKANQTIRVQLTDPSVYTENPNIENMDLIKSLTQPFEFSGKETRTFGRYGKTLEYITKIRRVIDNNNIELFQGLRFDHLSKYSPTIVAFTGISNVGVENIRFESAWQGQFVHHRPYPSDAIDESDIIRSETEQDYGWVAIWGAWLTDSWIENVVMDNYTQNIIFSNSAFIDIENILLKGTGGHAGLTYSSAHSILAKGITFEGRYSHPVSVRAWTSGCVFSDIVMLDSTYNSTAKTGPFIDFHGLYPYENLFENMQGFYVHSGGDMNVLPHSGVRNTLWNIETPDVIDRFSYSNNEFFSTAATSASNMYKYFPSSFVIGVFGKNDLEVRINRSAADSVNDFMLIKSLNSRDIPFQSLYQKQVELRQIRSPLQPHPPMLLDEG
jgi:hypothetical protein